MILFKRIITANRISLPEAIFALISRLTKPPISMQMGMSYSIIREGTVALKTRLQCRPSPIGASSYLPKLVELDFSHLRAEGVGIVLTHPLKERGSQRTCAPAALILATKVQALGNGLL
jgi:hypothetical protein